MKMHEPQHYPFVADLLGLPLRASEVRRRLETPSHITGPKQTHPVVTRLTIHPSMD